MPLSTNVGGSWKAVKEVHVNVNGVWKPVKKGYVNVNGVWKKFYENVLKFTVAGNVNNLNLFAFCGAPSGAVNAEIEILAGIVIGSTTTGNPALLISGFAAGSTIKLINRGQILGAGGLGGAGGTAVGVYNPGGAGGAAISLGNAVQIENYGSIFGGGGGGGGGGYHSYGLASKAGGAGGNGSGYGQAQTNGEAGGSAYARGAISYYAYGGDGGNGGAWGTVGENGELGGSGTQALNAGAGGAAGNSVRANGHAITWLATGSLAGPAA